LDQDTKIGQQNTGFQNKPSSYSLKMEEVDNKTMRRKGYCNIEKKETWFKRLPNNKWICESSNCSTAAGQCNEVPVMPKMPEPLKFQYV